MTICKNCRFVLILGHSFLDYKCTASQKTPFKTNPVTGTYYPTGRYRLCARINYGNCPKFRELK